MFVFFYLDYFFQFLELMIDVEFLNTVVFFEEHPHIQRCVYNVLLCIWLFYDLSETKRKLSTDIISYVQLMLNDLLEGV